MERKNGTEALSLRFPTPTKTRSHRRLLRHRAVWWKALAFLVASLIAGTAVPAAGAPQSLPGTQTFNNVAPIDIGVPVSGSDILKADLYPSNITASGMDGVVSRVVVELKNVRHSSSSDIDIMLVGPGGRAAMVMSDVGGSFDFEDVDLTIDDAELDYALSISDFVHNTESYRGVNHSDLSSSGADSFPDAPAGPYPTALSTFGGEQPNGTWSLYVVDDEGGTSCSVPAIGTQCSIAGGWSLTIETATPLATNAYVLTDSAPEPYEILGLNTAQPTVINSRVSVHGLLDIQETLEGIDVRPSNGIIYGLSKKPGAMQGLFRLYVINPKTGLAVRFLTEDLDGLEGSSFGLDFDPVRDKLRITGDNRSLLVDPDTGALAVPATSLVYKDGDRAFGYDPAVAGLGHTNSQAGGNPATTTVYGLDSIQETLVRIGEVDDTTSADTGLLTTIGCLRDGLVPPCPTIAPNISGITFTNGMKIMTGSSPALAALQLQSTPPSIPISILADINLATGVATPVNSGVSQLIVRADDVRYAIIGGGYKIRGFTIYTPGNLWELADPVIVNSATKWD